MKHCLLIIPLLLLCAHVARSQTPTKGAIDAFAANTGALPTIDPATGSLSFLRFPAQRALQIGGGDAQQKSMNFVAQYKALFALRTGEDEFRLREQKTDNYGLQNVTLQQTYKGVPVYDGLMKFHYNNAQSLTAVNGNFISEIKANVVPTLAQHEAESIAVGLVTTQQLGKSRIPAKAHKSTLYIFQKGLAQGYNGPKFLVYEVEVRNEADVREFLFIDAHSGQLIEQFKGMHNIHRELYETSISVANRKWQEGDMLPGTLDQWQQSEVQSAGFIYNLMKNAFGYVSYNGVDAAMITINNNPSINCPNANWNGVSANYCTGTATDDVVAHEWGHAYTEYTSGLIYQWQPGALNEAYSDIWGETVDQLDGYMDSGESNANRTGCASSHRWQMGEKATAFGGAIRDMWDPTCKGHPGKVTDPQYWCANTDDGGVHINSGVLNHAYALLVDGGTYNGQTISGVGLTKAAHIFWRAQSTYMTATTDFAAQADILEASATDLIGINLPGLSTGTSAPGASGQMITAADVAELSKVIAAVELRSANNCGFTTTLQPAPALCEGANEEFAIFYEDFESGLGAFTTSFSTTSAGWVNRQWQQVASPAGRPGHAAFGVDYQGGSCTVATDQSGVIRMDSPIITIPAGTAGNLNMAFDHLIAMEDTWDGGVVWYRINGAPTWTIVPTDKFTANAYNNTLNTASADNTNPLQGQDAFTGTDQGSVTGSWGQSQIDLTALGVLPGNTVQFRFELGTDLCGGVEGWYVDDVRVFTCAVTPAVHFVAASATMNEGEATTADPSGCLRYVDKVVTLGIDKAPTQPVTLTFSNPAGTAKQGATADYTISPASVTLDAGSLTKNVTIRVFNDAYVEGPETINLTYALNANGGNGYAASTLQSFELSINDDDLAPGNYTDELLNTNFNNGTQGWKAVNGGNSYHTWEIAQYTNAGFEDGSPFFFVNSSIANKYILDESLESPAINTSGRKGLVLTFKQVWEPIAGGDAEVGTVEVWDGSAWHILLTQNEATGNLGSLFGYSSAVKELAIPAEYANVNMKIRFRYISRSERWWAIDDVKLTSTNSTQILSTVNTGNAAKEYLGPNETAVFYDPTDGYVMARIKNLSAHDYGCTTVEIDRAGANSTAWLGGFQVSNKTFKVTPTNNNPNGQYEITLYYNNSELTTFTPESIQSMGKSPGNISTSNGTSTALVSVVTTPAFNGDNAFTATFTTGFSGFGLSNAPPGSALPVTLVSFEGKHTAEGNVLQWTTTSESNNDYFAIEESTNGKHFVETGRVKGVGNASGTNQYSFTDVDFNKGITYYRLKQVDFDGKYAYSRMVAIDAPSAGNIRFYPNPVQSALNIELPNVHGTWVNAKVINTSGQTVLVKEKAAIQNGKVNIQLGKLPAGIYQVLITDDKVNYRLSVFKP